MWNEEHCQAVEETEECVDLEPAFVAVSGADDEADDGEEVVEELFAWLVVHQAPVGVEKWPYCIF